MKNGWRWLLAVVLPSWLLMGCGLFSFPAKEYAQALCDVYYKEEFEDYSVLTGMKEKEIQKDYDDAVAMQSQAYMDYFGIDELDEDGMKRLGKFVKSVYAFADYHISSVSEKGNGFVIKVKVKPIAFYQLAEKQIKEYQEEFRLKAEDGEYLKLDEAAYQSEYLDGLLEVYEKQMDGIEYLEEKEFTLTLQKSGKEYVLEDEGFADLDAAIVSFSK